MPERWVFPGPDDPSLRVARCWRCEHVSQVMVRYVVSETDTNFECEVCHSIVQAPAGPPAIEPPPEEPVEEPTT